jgi:anaerobic selenocysteine-containing dehydrogenase
VLKAIAADPERSLIVIDPRRTEAADLADLHLRVRPGGDAFLLAAMLAVLVEEDLLDLAFLEERAEGHDAVVAAVRDIVVGS